MKKVITYGTYDLLHEGHKNLLRRAKELGDYLIVGVTSDSFDRERGKLNVRNTLLERVESVKATGYADEIIIEDYIGQKVDDIQRLDVDVFAIGSDWIGKFDYLKEFCEVIYLPRTEGISSSLLRAIDQKQIRLGVIGTGRIANRFIPETRYVTGVQINSVFNPSKFEAEKFATRYDIEAFDNLDLFLNNIEAVYIASPHLTHYNYIKKCLLHNRHVLCEIPIVLSENEAIELYALASERNLVLLEASKTAFCPAFSHLISLIKSGVIGNVVDVRASLSKLTTDKNLRELQAGEAGGCVTELAHFPLLSIFKILGVDYVDINFHSKMDAGVDVFTKGIINFNHAVSTITLGLGVKTEGNLVVSGTKGYIYVPAPWWRTDYFEVRYEDQTSNKKYFYPFEGEGLRYELYEFASMIFGKRYCTHYITRKESIAIVKVIDMFRRGNNLTII